MCKSKTIPQQVTINHSHTKRCDTKSVMPSINYTFDTWVQHLLYYYDSNYAESSSSSTQESSLTFLHSVVCDLFWPESKEAFGTGGKKRISERRKDEDSTWQFCCLVRRFRLLLHKRKLSVPGRHHNFHTFLPFGLLIFNLGQITMNGGERILLWDSKDSRRDNRKHSCIVSAFRISDTQQDPFSAS